MTYGSLCSGIEAATEAWKHMNWQPAFFAEIEPFCCEVLKQRHPNAPNLGDINAEDFIENAKERGPIDVLVGGPPCQAFSVAGLRGGLADPRGNLTLRYLAVVDALRPRWVLYENVPGILSATSHVSPDPRPPCIDLDGDDGPAVGTEEMVVDEYDSDEDHAFSCFLAGLSELGYRWCYAVLDAQYFGVAQRRERVFVVGYPGDWQPAAAVLLDRESMSGHHPPSRKAGERTSAATESGAGGSGYELSPPLTNSGRGVERTGESRGQDCVIPVANTLKGNSGRIELSGNSGKLPQEETIVTGAVSSKWAKGTGGPAGDECYNLVKAPTLTGNPYSDHKSREGPLVSHTLTGEGFNASEDGTGRGTPIVPIGFWGNQSGADAVRRLTPLECSRLQGFDDGYLDIIYNGKPATDSPKYKALGNSMAVPCMRWIGERIAAVDAALRGNL